MYNVIIKILDSKKFIESDSTSQLLVETLVNLTTTEAHFEQLWQWF
jgi:hypothetical protein